MKQKMMLTAGKTDTVDMQIDLTAMPGLFFTVHKSSGRITFLVNAEHAQTGLPAALSLKETPAFFQLSAGAFEKNKSFTLSLHSGLKYKCFSREEGDLIFITGVSDQPSASETGSKEIEEFAYIASHDLQEPLRKVSTYVERMTDKLDEDKKEELRAYTDRIAVSLKNMQVLIDDLLQFSRAAKQTKQVSIVDLNIVLQRVLTDNELKIEESKARIFLQPLPVVEGDASQLQQVFNNLISNALKFVNNNEAPVIYVSKEQLTQEERSSLPPNSAFIKIVIRDEGIGFDPQYATKIFDMFSRLNPKHAYKGSGIGLAICKKIISNHHGIITAHNNDTKGSVFSVILPEKQLND